MKEAFTMFFNKGEVGIHEENLPKKKFMRKGGHESTKMMISLIHDLL